MGEITNTRQNKLAYERSPYLLQHAENPVDWYPWGSEGFEKARKENKPIFLSIGYSTCHWCHVMAHESFEDPEVAKLMNDNFISIKVDREERPDIDKIYMTVCQMMTGSGGWPLTIIMTPDKEPFFAATYVPKKTNFGRIGMFDLIARIKELWSTRQSDIINSASLIIKSLHETSVDIPGEELGEFELQLCYDQLTSHYESQYGGFGDAPKFPTPHNLYFLLCYWKRTGNEKVLNMVEKTLQAMRQGGICDHVGFGFHRYSTDSQWLVPHFEKMLYDQALLAIAYTETYQATKKEEYYKTAREIFTYVLRDMTSPEGAFYSAEDADTEGEEGKFYLWTQDEIYKVLSNEEAELAAKVFNILENGNFTDELNGEQTGKNIPHLTKSTLEIAADLDISERDLQSRVEIIRHKMFKYREKKVHPHKDDKVLTDWNGLMIAALANGARVFGESQYVDAAIRAKNFIMTNLRTPDGRLLHRYREGQAAVPANLDDYAFFTYGLLELYETTFDVSCLKTALEMNRDLIEHFWDDSGGGFYFTPNDGESLLFRQKEVYDGAIPSGNSVAMLNLLRLGRITGDAELEQKASETGKAFAVTVKQLPSACTQLMVAVDFAVGPSYEVIIAGNSRGRDTEQLLTAIHKSFIPNKIVVLRPTEEENPEIDIITPFARYHSSRHGKATAYVCLDYNCQLPTTDMNTMLELLSSKR